MIPSSNFHTLCLYNKQWHSKPKKDHLSIDAIRSSINVSIRKDCTLYEVPETSVRRKMNGHPLELRSAPMERSIARSGWIHGGVMADAAELGNLEYI